nr:odorant receptor 2.8 [Danio rerio]AAH86731.1 Odorant receptor, family D, subfamily 111, member 11 [Danio rerio]AAI64128.1 Or111-11 protein [Danio rerio]
MSSDSASFSSNISIVHPEYFFITGLSGTEYSNYYYIFLFFLYIVAVIGNFIVLLIIALERSLHSPKYIAVFNLALADIGEMNALVPNMIKMFLFESQYISYNACMVNMFFVHFFTTMQSFTLVVMSYDRFVAICLPLRYHAIVNNTVISVVFLVLWAFNVFVLLVVVGMITRLSICKSNVILSYYCDHGPVYKLACNDNSINSFLGKLSTALYLVAPLIIIFLSYVGVFLALSKITTWEGRLKALKTCVAHLLLAGSFFVPIFSIYIASIMNSLTPNARVLSTSLSYVLPPTLNPILYVLNTAEIKQLIKKIIKNRSTKTVHVAS